MYDDFGCFIAGEWVNGQAPFEVVSPVSEKPRREDGSWHLEDKLSDEQLRQFVAEIKTIADEHEIPDEPFEISISDEVRKIVDEVLGPENVEAEETDDFGV